MDGWVGRCVGLYLPRVALNNIANKLVALYPLPVDARK